MNLRLTSNKYGNKYQDELVWGCLGQGVVKQYAKRKEKRQCNTGYRCIRHGTWLTRVNKPIAYIMEAIFYWVNDVKQSTISTWTGLTGPVVTKITRACRLVAAKFMQANPHLNRIGGTDINGKPIVCQIDETHCGKMKYHKGKPRKSTWVL